MLVSDNDIVEELFFSVEDEMENLFGGDDDLEQEGEFDEGGDLDDVEQDDEFEDDDEEELDEDGNPIGDPEGEEGEASAKKRINPDNDDITHAIDCPLDETCTCGEE